MSHFSVMVIGDNIERQLEPYDENKDVYIDMTEALEEELKELIKYTIWADGKRPYYGIEAVGKTVTFKNMPDEPNKIIYEDTKKEVFGTIQALAEYKGYELNEEDGKWYRRYNPNSKWDWYSIGGRWSDMLIHVENPKYPEKIIQGEPGAFGYPDNRPQNSCDAAAFCDIDWEAMAEYDRNKAVARHERFLEQNPKLKEGMNRDEINAVLDGEPIQDGMYLWSYDRIPTKKEVEDEAYSLTTYAIVKDGIWYEKGKMGWFGISTDEKSCAEWSEIYEKLIDGIPEDTTITIIDCHI